MKRDMELYYKYQPVTWYIGVIEADPEDVARAIQPLYAPPDELRGIHREVKPVETALANLEPLGLADKFLMVETKDGRTVLFGNAFFSFVQMPTWTVGESLDVSAYFVCNVPNTISRDQRSGAYGGRILEFRKPEDPYGQEPTFYVGVINDAGRWCFYRYGEERSFEDKKAYKARRKRDRFTVEMLVEYCRELGIPVYDRSWYSENIITIHTSPLPDAKGLTYDEAKKTN